VALAVVQEQEWSLDKVALELPIRVTTALKVSLVDLLQLVAVAVLVKKRQVKMVAMVSLALLLDLL
jgi:hypothetical protein